VFDEIDPGWHGHGTALRMACLVLLPLGALASALAGHLFLCAACVAALGALWRAHWAWAPAGLLVGIGSALTPHRPEFANIGDLLLVLVIFSYGLAGGLVLLVPKRTRRLALWILVGTLLIPAGCFGTGPVREAIGAPARTAARQPGG
jgi:hypothetical protein